MASFCSSPTNSILLSTGGRILPKGGQLEFFLDWSMEFDELPPGEYLLSLNLWGRVMHPLYLVGNFGTNPDITFIVDG